jgi:putative PIN family toxin of toxin-antitoxin system
MPNSARSAVLDSTVLVSAFLATGGVSAELLRHARGGVFLCCLSNEILEETQRVLSYPRIRRRYTYTTEEVTEFCEGLRMAAQLVTDLPTVAAVPRDPQDNPIVATAIKAQASHLITRDDDLLSLQTYGGITMMTPEAFMTMLRAQGRVE